MSVTAARGFVAAGTHCGIKAAGVPDLALVATDDARPVAAAAVFTRNRAAAAPVQVSRAHLDATGGRAAAVILNSGNANAATGPAGLAAASRMCELVARQLGCATEEVLVCSTGLIGIPLPMAPIEQGVGPLVAARSASGGGAAARAIMTTDTVPKEASSEGAGFVVGGMAKGAAMLAPDMATMLAVLTTDAAVGPQVLAGVLRRAADATFNRLTIDGCTSTNDTVILLASGRGAAPSDDELGAAVTSVCASLARQMAADAEGATRTATVRITGAASPEEAARAARKVAQSPLVKCSLYGGDPYWGRVVSEVGSAGVAFDLDRVTVAYGGVVVCRGGVAWEHDHAAVAAHMAGPEIEVHADLGVGTGEATVLTCDLTPGYIEENMRTS